ncbi:hypothetical protein, partial [Shigella flexneri]|uniref:hypothetical protein n=1 Tax=Shigella flexneri TaxID=623 RepID=UPI0019D49B45
LNLTSIRHPLNWMTKKTINDSSITDKARVIGPIFYLLLFAAKEINSQRDCQQHSKDQAINKNHR